jgi:uncharacterized protein YycO
MVRLGLFPVLFLLLAAYIVVDNGHLWKERESVVFTYVDSFMNGKIGSGYGAAQNRNLDLTGLEPGDIILGGWTNCAYGQYSHAGLYIGNHQVLEGYVDYGLTIQDLDHYINYVNLCLLHVEASPQIKNQAVEYALKYEGDIFYPVAFKSGARFWNCSKIIWKAYQRQGLELDAINDLWIAPDRLARSEHVKELYRRGI